MKHHPAPSAGSRSAANPSPRMIDTASDWLARQDAGLTPAEAAEFSRWRHADPRHAAAVEQLRTTWAVLDRPLEAGAADDVLCELGRSAVRRRRRRLAGAALGLAVLFAIGTVWQNERRTGWGEGSPATAKVLQPTRQTLPDGTVVELRDAARIAFDFGPELRRVVLPRGEALFQVAKNPARPFVVVAGGVEVRAVGTAFSVQVGQTAVDVLVTEGRVAVGRAQAVMGPPAPDGHDGRSTNGEPAAPLRTVDAGHRIVIGLAQPSAANAAVAAVSAAEMSERLAWRVPRLEFSATPLAEAVRLINRYNRVQFVIEDPTLAREQVSGLFRADNIEAFVHVLQNGFAVNAERSDDTITLRKRR